MKTLVDQLAILGGTPEFADVAARRPPEHRRPEGLFARIQGALDRRLAHQQRPARRRSSSSASRALLGVRHCIAMCNGTVALEIAIARARARRAK